MFAPEILPPFERGTPLLFHEYEAVAGVEPDTVLVARRTAFFPEATVTLDAEQERHMNEIDIQIATGRIVVGGNRKGGGAQ